MTPPTASALHEPRAGAPLSSLVMSIAALAIPVLATSLWPGWTSRDVGVLVWLLALIPPFLLSYHRGWRGASTALAGAMAAYAVAQVVVVRSTLGLPPPAIMLGVTAALIAVSLGAGALASQFDRRLRAAEDLALTDSVTGLPNRRYAMLHLGRAFAAAGRGEALTVVLFDIDQVGRIGDRWGHPVLDDVLRRFADVLTSRTRRMHLSARTGEGAFLTVLDGSDPEGATVFVEKVLTAVRAMELPWGKITARAGLASYESGMESEDVLLAAAEQALYRAKTSGQAEGGWARADMTGDAAGDRRLPARHAASQAPGYGATILVVDDDPTALRLVVRVLRRAGYRTLSAATASQAEHLARESLAGVDLVVTDVVMPGADGFQLVNRIQHTGRPVPVLYISGYDRDELRWDVVPGSPKRFLGKPFEMDRLLEEVRGLLGEAVQSKTEGRASEPQRAGTLPGLQA